MCHMITAQYLKHIQRFLCNHIHDILNFFLCHHIHVSFKCFQGILYFFPLGYIRTKRTIYFMWQTAMAVPVKWTQCLLLLLPFQVVADDFEIVCKDETKSCTQCYSEFVKQVLTNDTNQFNIQNTFFPPNKSSPAFVTISYEYYQDNEPVNET